MKITIENQNFLKRLQNKQSNYSVERWEEDFRETEKRMASMCEYPFQLQTNSSALRAKQMALLGDESRPGTRFQTEGGNAAESTGLLSRGNLPRIGTGMSGQRATINKSFQSLNNNPGGPP